MIPVASIHHEFSSHTSLFRVDYNPATIHDKVFYIALSNASINRIDNESIAVCDVYNQLSAKQAIFFDTLTIGNGNLWLADKSPVELLNDQSISGSFKSDTIIGTKLLAQKYLVISTERLAPILPFMNVRVSCLISGYGFDENAQYMVVDDHIIHSTSTGIFDNVISSHTNLIISQDNKLTLTFSTTRLLPEYKFSIDFLNTVGYDSTKACSFKQYIDTSSLSPLVDSPDPVVTVGGMQPASRAEKLQFFYASLPSSLIRSKFVMECPKAFVPYSPENILTTLKRPAIGKMKTTFLETITYAGVLLSPNIERYRISRQRCPSRRGCDDPFLDILCSANSDMCEIPCSLDPRHRECEDDCFQNFNLSWCDSNKCRYDSTLWGCPNYDPCKDDPTGEDCPEFDPCISRPKSPGCPEHDPCEEDPTIKGCPDYDPCLDNPKIQGCPEYDPCLDNPSHSGCPKDPCVEDPTAFGCPDYDICQENPTVKGCPLYNPCEDLLENNCAEKGSCVFVMISGECRPIDHCQIDKSIEGCQKTPQSQDSGEFGTCDVTTLTACETSSSSKNIILTGRLLFIIFFPLLFLF